MTEEVTDDEIKKLEEDLKKLEEKDTSYGSPSATQKDNLFKFFNKILTTKDTTRVGNLSNTEAGISNLSVMGWKRIAHYAKAEGLNLVNDYIKEESEIITSVSMSKKGFWPKLFVTQIRQEKKVKDTGSQKKGWFGGKKEEGE